MTQYAFYDLTIASPSPVTGWYDTDALVYPSLPPSNNLYEMTSEEWDNRIIGYWAISDNQLVSYTPSPPVLTVAQQATVRLTQGLKVTSGAWPDFSGTYAVDPTSQGKIGAISTYILVNSTFPGGLTQYPWVDTKGTPHVCPTTTTFQQFATAVADYIATLDVIIATGSGKLPDATATIN